MVELATSKGKKIEVTNVGDMMHEKSKTLGYKIRPGTILDNPERTLDYLRRIVFEDIIRKKDYTENLIINTHGCFRWHKHLTKAFNYYHLTQLDPDLYITVTDTIYSIMGRLERKQWKGKNNLLELSMWRNEEEFITKTFARIQGKPHYLVCKNDPPETMYKLVFERNVKKTYLSFPVSASPKASLKKVEEVRDRLRNHLVVFYPLAIQDASWLTRATALEKKKKRKIEIPFIDTDDSQRKLTRPIDAFKNAAIYLKDHTISRDYSLISQSDFVAVYYYDPDLSSPGVEREIRFARQNGKDVYMYYPRSDMSPFREMDITKHFLKEENFMDFLINI